jgi:competence protein ComEC
VVQRSPEVRGQLLRFEAALRVTCDGAHVAPGTRAVLYAQRDEVTWPLARGDTLALIVQIAPREQFASGFTRASLLSQVRSGIFVSGSVLSARQVAQSWSPRAIIDRTRHRTRLRIERDYPATVAPLARALVLGEMDMDPESDEAFRASGLSHLLAVSGTHLVLVVLGLIGALRFVLVRVPAIGRGGRCPSRYAAAIGVPVTWLYAEFAGGSGSCARAASMVGLLLVVTALGKRADGPRALCATAVLFVCKDPFALTDVSFALSLAATAGLVWIEPALHAADETAWPAWKKALLAPLRTSAAAQVACTPVLSLFAPSVSAIGLFANLIAVPIGEIFALPSCIAHAAASPWPSLARGCMLVAAGALAALARVAHTASSLWWATVSVPPPTAFQMAALALGAVALALGLRRKSVVWCTCLSLLALELWAHRPPAELTVTFLDVGQGDAALVRTPEGHTLLIDAGGLVGSPVDTGAVAIAPVLRAQRVRRVDRVVLSHPHPDHFLGLAAATKGVSVGAIWDTGQGEHEGTQGAYAAFLRAARRQGVPVLGPAQVCGEHRLGELRVTVLAPCPGVPEGVSANDGSFVLHLRYGARSFLFVGDAEHEAERTMLLRAAQGASLRADVLKVGHHGSRTSSSPEFLRAVAPTIGVIGTGVRNRFGHPHAQTLESLAQQGIGVYRTDLDGSVTVRTNGRTLTVDTAIPR